METQNHREWKEGKSCIEIKRLKEKERKGERKGIIIAGRHVTL